ncbi:uncharacterized protein BDW43DRAFT_278497 [Aspergillus alliaceus]|nr:uncharacterized protein BDW43DRAFT_278497 [Aspergillus alliaceus]KAB8232762.1 hypothetical protein BDW43DRAFT_278497 [Aspergillus alliaceus]
MFSRDSSMPANDGFVEEPRRAGGPKLCELPSVFYRSILSEEFPPQDISAIAKK